MLIEAQIRQAFFEQIVKANGVRVENGRVREIAQDEFEQCTSWVMINTLQKQGLDGGPTFLGECCKLEMAADLDISIFVPVDYADELECVSFLPVVRHVVVEHAN